MSDKSLREDTKAARENPRQAVPIWIWGTTAFMASYMVLLQTAACAA